MSEWLSAFENRRIETYLISAGGGEGGREGGSGAGTFTRKEEKTELLTLCCPSPDRPASDRQCPHSPPSRSRPARRCSQG